MKKKIIQEIQSHLADELASLAKNEQSTEALERIVEIQRLLLQYQFLPIREYGVEDVICPATLVELDLAGLRTYCFIVPQGGGMIMQIDGKPVQVVTSNSPLGGALLGKRVGDSIELQVGRSTRIYRVVSIA